jgi:hypothetical protein
MASLRLPCCTDGLRGYVSSPLSDYEVANGPRLKQAQHRQKSIHINREAAKGGISLMILNQSGLSNLQAGKGVSVMSIG